MKELHIAYPEDLLLTSGQSPEDLERELRFFLALKLFELRRLTVGKAAALAGMNKIHFMDEAGRHRVPVINLEVDQVEDELRDD